MNLQSICNLFKRAASNRAIVKFNRATLDLECLETRSMLTAGITTSVSRGVLTITGTEGNDHISVQQRDGGIYIHDGAGNYISSRRLSVVGQVKVVGLGGNDVIDLGALRGSAIVQLPGVVSGGNGDDRVYGGWGNDLLFGGTGNDRIYGHGGNDELQGGDGNDRLWAGSGNDLLFGQAGSDQLVGESGDDELQGGAGDDELWGYDGNDRLFGQAGFDFLLGGNGNDYLNGGGFNNVEGAWEGAAAWGGSGNDRFFNCPQYLAFDLVGHPRPVAPFTTSVSGEPGIQDFGVGDTRDALSSRS